MSERVREIEQRVSEQHGEGAVSVSQHAEPKFLTAQDQRRMLSPLTTHAITNVLMSQLMGKITA